MVTFRVSPDEKVRIQANAATSGLSNVGDYCRMTALAGSTPPQAYYTNSVVNTLSGLEGAIQQAKAALTARPEETPDGGEVEDRHR